MESTPGGVDEASAKRCATSLVCVDVEENGCVEDIDCVDVEDDIRDRKLVLDLLDDEGGEEEKTSVLPGGKSKVSDVVVIPDTIAGDGRESGQGRRVGLKMQVLRPNTASERKPGRKRFENPVENAVKRIVEDLVENWNTRYAGYEKL